MKTVLNAWGGIQTSVALEDGNLITGTTQDCTPFLEHAANLRSAGATGSADMRLAARIPFVVVEKYCNDKGITWREFSGSPVHMNGLLNDRDYRNLRVWEGRV